MIYFYNIKETTEHTKKSIKYNQRDIIIVTENEKLK